MVRHNRVITIIARRNCLNIRIKFFYFLQRFLTAHAAGVKDPNVLLGVQIYFFARLAHYAVYVLGVPIIRPLVYFVVWGGMALIAYALLTPTLA